MKQHLTHGTFNIFSLPPLVMVLLLFCIVDAVTVSIVAVSVSIVAAFDVAVDGTSAVDATANDAVATLLFLRWVRANDTIVLSREVLVELPSLASVTIVAIVGIVCC